MTEVRSDNSFENNSSTVVNPMQFIPVVSSNSEVMPSPTGGKQHISFNSMISTTSAPNCVIVGVKQQSIFPITARKNLQNDALWSRKTTLTHECDLCSKVFTTPSGLRKHSVTHSESRPFSCEYCDKCFKRSDHLSSHLLSIHKKFKYTYTCSLEECSKEFKDEKTCQDHVAEHQKVLERINEKPAAKDDLKKPSNTVQLSLGVCDKNDNIVTGSVDSDCKDMNDNVIQTDGSPADTPKMVVTVSTQSVPDIKQNPINMPSSDKLLQALSNLAAEVKKKATHVNAGSNVMSRVCEDAGSSSSGSPKCQKNIVTSTPNKASPTKSASSAGSNTMKILTLNNTFKLLVPVDRSPKACQSSTSPKKVPICIKLTVEPATSSQPVNIQRILSTMTVQNHNLLSVIKPIQPAVNYSTQPSLTLIPLPSGVSIPKTVNQIQEDKIEKLDNVTKDPEYSKIVSSLNILKGPSKSDLTCHICQRVFHSVRARCGHARVHQSTSETTSAKSDMNTVVTNNNTVVTNNNTVVTNNNTTDSLLNILAHHPVSASKDHQPVNQVIAGTHKVVPNVASYMVGTKTVAPVLAGSVRPIQIIASPLNGKNIAQTAVAYTKQATIPGTIYMLPVQIPSQIKPSANVVAPTVTQFGIRSSPYEEKTPLQPNEKSKDSNKDCDDFLFTFLNPEYFKNNGSKTAEQLQNKETGVKQVHKNNLLCNNYWQPDEIERYQVGMLKFGKDSESLASYVGTRTKTQCEKFYHLLTRLKPSMVDSFNQTREPWEVPLHQERRVDLAGANWNDLDSLDDLMADYRQCVTLKPKRLRTKYVFHKTWTFGELEKQKEEEKEFRRLSRRRKRRQLKSIKSTRIMNTRKTGMTQIKLSEKKISSEKAVPVAVSLHHQDRNLKSHVKSAIRTGTNQLSNVITDMQHNSQQDSHKQVPVVDKIKRSKRVKKRKLYLGEELDSPARKQTRRSTSDVREPAADNSFKELPQIRSSEKAA